MSQFGAANKDVCTTHLHAEEEHKLQRFMMKSAAIFESTITDEFVIATTKPCPSCSIRTTHYHGHYCHHISPVSDGCPNCHSHYCYKCLSTEEDNVLHRTQRSSCQCGFWSMYCKSLVPKQDVVQYLVLEPVSHDSRCGCIICPECDVGQPCSQCPGNCDVCMGYINRGPASLVGNAWKAISETKMGTGDIIRFRQAFHELCRACMQQDRTRVAQLLRQWGDKLDVTRRDQLGRAPLDYACDLGDVETMALLVGAGANCEALDRDGLNPLLRCCEYGHFDAASFLYDRGVDLNVADRHGESPLVKACRNNHERLVRLLSSDCRTDVNAGIVGPAGRGLTALHFAVHYENSTMVQTLTDLDHLDPNVSNADGFTPLHWAVMSGNLQIASMIWTHLDADCNVRSSDGNTPIHFCALYGADKIAAVLALDLMCEVDLANDDGLTAMHICCQRGSIEVARILNERCCAVNTVSRIDGSSPLYVACLRGQTQIVAMLLERGVDIAVTCAKDRSTALHAACYHGHDNIVQQLLAAIKAKRLEAAELLDAVTACGYSPLMYACRNNHDSCAKMLIATGAACHFQARTTDGGDGKTALHWTSYHGNLSITRLLLSKLFPAAVAAVHPQHAHRPQQQGRQYTQALLLGGSGSSGLRGQAGLASSHPSDGPGIGRSALVVVDVVDRNGCTPLYKACERRHESVARLLLADYGADPLRPCKDRLTPAALAAQNCLLELLMLL